MRSVLLSLFLFVICCLSGCGVSLNKLGISQHEWEQYTEQRQSRILKNYMQIAGEKKAQRQTENSMAKDSWLEVNVSGGLVMMPPFIFSNSYTPASFKIYQNDCTNVKLKNLNLNDSVDLEACYKNNILFVDPSNYELDKKDGSIQLYSSPLWRNGFTYQHINTSGYARLQNANITVSSYQKKSDSLTENSNDSPAPSTAY